LTNFVNKFLGTVKFGNDHVAKIMGYRDYQIGNVTISRVYFADEIGHNLFSVGQFCDLDLEASKTKSWLWHRRLSHLNFGAINHLARQGLVRGLPKLKFEKDYLCSTCAMGKSKLKSHKPKSEDTNQEKLYFLHMDLCGPMRVESVNGKKYILVIVDDYFDLHSVDYPASKIIAPIAEVVALELAESTGLPFSTTVDQDVPSPSKTQTTPKTQPLVIPNDVEEDNHDIKVAHIGKLQPKADIGIFIGYVPIKKAFRIYNRRTRRIIKTIHVDFDELTAMAST
nr:hypothetical protein [Tanacetum cinerariifolium]